MGRVLPFLLCAVPVCAQFLNLTTTNDGGALYFSTVMRLKGSDHFNSAKIYRYAPDGGFSLVAQVACDRWAPHITNPCHLVEPDITSDGKVLAYTAAADCVGGSGCMFALKDLPVLVGAALPQGILSNSLPHLSRNGRYLYASGTYPKLFDLTAGSVFDLPANSAPDRYQAVADDGTIALQDSDGALLFRAGSTTRLAFSSRAAAIHVSGDGRRIVYETTPPSRIVAYDVATGRETPLGEGVAPSLSADGLWTVFRAGSPQQVFLASTGGGFVRQMTTAAEGVTAAVLSGAANRIYAATASNRLLEIDTASGTVRQLTNRVPQIDSAPVTSPGSLVEITGAGLYDETGAAAAWIDGVEMPVIFAPPALYAQIPWEVRDFDHQFVLRVRDEPDTLFERPYSSYLARHQIFFLTAGPSAIMSHEDFHGPVTNDDPAAPNEVVHFWMTGLGAVDRPILTGQYTPVGPLWRATLPPSCQLYNGPAPFDVKVEFAGLAPTLLGIYQMSLRMPPFFLSAGATLTCTQGFPPEGLALTTVPVQY